MPCNQQAITASGLTHTHVYSLTAQQTQPPHHITSLIHKYQPGCPLGTPGHRITPARYPSRKKPHWMHDMSKLCWCSESRIVMVISAELHQITVTYSELHWVTFSYSEVTKCIGGGSALHISSVRYDKCYNVTAEQTGSGLTDPSSMHTH